MVGFLPILVAGVDLFMAACLIVFMLGLKHGREAAKRKLAEHMSAGNTTADRPCEESTSRVMVAITIGLVLIGVFTIIAALLS